MRTTNPMSSIWRSGERIRGLSGANTIRSSGRHERPPHRALGPGAGARRQRSADGGECAVNTDPHGRQGTAPAARLPRALPERLPGSQNRPSLGLNRVLLHYVINPARLPTTNIRRYVCWSRICSISM